MDTVERLRELNPGLEIYSVFDSRFRPYGRLLPAVEDTEFRRAFAAQPIPEQGNRYAASVPELEETAFIRGLRRSVFGEMDIEAGYCNGRGHMLNALEYHKCSEVNFSTTGLVLLLALPGCMDDGRLDSSSVCGFYLPPDTVVEIFPLVLHFAPCRVSDDGFNCLVVLERGVNSPSEHVDISAPGEEKLFWMRGKWLTCHPDSPQARKGAFAGISGTNIDLKI